MATRKQRRRRQKERRHQYEYVYVDERGEEVEVEEGEVERAVPRPKEKEKEEKPKAAPYRAGREVPPPSWRRVARRGLIFAPFMFLTLLLLDREQAYGVLAINTIVLLAFFLPFSYVLDTLMYRVYVKRARAGGQSGRTAARRR